MSGCACGGKKVSDFRMLGCRGCGSIVRSSGKKAGKKVRGNVPAWQRSGLTSREKASPVKACDRHL